MREPSMREVLRTIEDEPAVPSREFADALFDRLIRDLERRAPEPTRARSHRVFVRAAVAITAVAISVVIVLPLLPLAGRHDRIGPFEAGSAVQARIALGGGAGGVVVGDGSVWVVANAPKGKLLRIDPSTNAIDASIDLGGKGNLDVAFGYGAVWVQNADRHAIQRIDPSTNEVVATIPVPHPVHLAMGAGSVWTSNYGGGAVTRIDPDSNRVIATIDVHGSEPHGLAFADGSMWVALDGAGGVVRIDPATNRATSFVDSGSSGPLRAAFGSLWGPSGEDRLLRIDPGSEAVAASIDVGAPEHVGLELDVDENGVWVVYNDWQNGTSPRPILTRVDPATTAVVGTIALPMGDVYAVASGYGSVWAVSSGDGVMLRIDPGAVLGSTLAPKPSPTPAAAASPQTTTGGSGVVSPIEQGGWVVIRPDYGTGPVDLRAVAANGDGFVAIGDTSVADGGPATWFSPDGRQWMRADPTTAPSSNSLWDVVAAGPGFVTVGVDDASNPGAWYSTDGRTWTAASVDLPSRIGNVDAMFGVLVTRESALIGWGRVRNGDAYVWTSTDGRAWSSVADESVFAGDGEQFISWITEDDGGFVAGGYDRPSGSTGEGHAVKWSSPDGLTWTREPSDSITMSVRDWTWMHLNERTTATGPLGTVRLGGYDGQHSSTIRFHAAD